MEETERHQIIDQGLSTRFWREIVMPELEQRRHAGQVALRNPTLLRKNQLPDDYVRGQLDLIEDLLSRFYVDVEVNRNVAIEEDLASRRENEYTDLRATYGYGLDVLQEG